MHFKIETVSALPTNFSHRKLRLRADRKSGVPVRQPPGWPVAPLRLQAYRDTARSLGYPLAVVSLVKLTLRALLSGTFLQRKDVNQCLGVWVKLGGQVPSDCLNAGQLRYTVSWSVCDSSTSSPACRGAGWGVEGSRLEA